MKIKTAVLILYILAGAVVAHAQVKRPAAQALGGAAPQRRIVDYLSRRCRGGQCICSRRTTT